MKFLLLKDDIEFNLIISIIDAYLGLPNAGATTWSIAYRYADPLNTRHILPIRDDMIPILIEQDHDYGYLLMDTLPFDYMTDQDPNIPLDEFKIYFDATMKQRAIWGQHVITEFRAFVVKNLNPDTASSSSMFQIYDQILTLLSTGALKEAELALQTLPDPTLDLQYDVTDTIRVHFQNEILRGS